MACSYVPLRAMSLVFFYTLFLFSIYDCSEVLDRKSNRKQRSGFSVAVNRSSGVWSDIRMPTKSFFAGFPPPDDLLKWKRAIMCASEGEQVLLGRVLKAIRSPMDLWAGDQNFKWAHRLADHFASNSATLPREAAGTDARATVVMLGYSLFDRPAHEGHNVDGRDFSMNDILKTPNFKFPSKIVGIGRMNENFGYLSTYFLNRSLPAYGFSFDEVSNPFLSEYRSPSKQVEHVLNDSNLVMLVVNQHHNVSHPKVISVPLGVQEPRGMWRVMREAVTDGVRKDPNLLLYSGGSDWGFRPAVRECVARAFTDSTGSRSAFVIERKQLSVEDFRRQLVRSMAVLAIPGQGYDTYRLWEALAAGAMPVLERGMGMDRTFYRLPVLLLDDFAELTESLVRTAYVEAVYRALDDQWQFARMTRRWYERIVFDAATTGSARLLQKLHPMGAEDASFTRPLVPYSCSAGCGPGTKRTPRRSCAIDPALVRPGIDWFWDHRARSGAHNGRARSLSTSQRGRKDAEREQTHRQTRTMTTAAVAPTRQ